MTEMEFSIKNRLVLLATLPASGSIDSLRILRKLREDLSFSEEEHTAFNLKGDENGAFKWDMAAEKPKAVEVGAKAAEIIKKALEALNKKEALTDNHVELWDRFCEEK